MCWEWVLLLGTLGGWAAGQEYRQCGGSRVIEVGENHVTFCCNVSGAFAFEANDPELYQTNVGLSRSYSLVPVFNRSRAELEAQLRPPPSQDPASGGVLVPLYPSQLFVNGRWYVVCGYARDGCTSCVPVRACTCGCADLPQIVNATVGLVPRKAQDPQDSVRVASWITDLSDFGSLESTITWDPYLCEGTNRAPLPSDSPSSCIRPSLSYNTPPRVVKSEDLVTGVEGSRTFGIELSFLLNTARLRRVFGVNIADGQRATFARLTGAKASNVYVPINFTQSLAVPFANTLSDAAVRSLCDYVSVNEPASRGLALEGLAIGAAIALATAAAIGPLP